MLYLGLRLHGAAPSALERFAPESSPPLTILGYKIPPGTIVASQAWSAHRQKEIFSDPERFIPERWLSDGCTGTESKVQVDERMSSTSALMAANMTPFGFGPRVCAGQNLAMVAIRMVLAAVARNFNITAPPETNEKSMFPLDGFVR